MGKTRDQPGMDDLGAERLARCQRELSAFTHSVSHDLQEPLRMVSGYLQLLRDECAPELSPEGREYVEVAFDGARRMRAMLEGLTRLARLGVDFEPVPIAPLDCWSEARGRLRREIRESGAQVGEDPLPFRLCADPQQLRQVFEALLRNGLAFHAPGEPPRIHLSGETRDGQALLRVRDVGLGLPPDRASRAFELFVTLHPDHPGRGAGVGLALARHVVEAHGGSIWIEAASPRGTQVCLTLPLAGREE